MTKPREQQLNLLSDQPVSNNKAPSTSVEAEHHITRTGRRAKLQHRVLGLIADYPRRTSYEIYEMYRIQYREPGMQISTIRARVTELKEKKFIRECGRKASPHTGIKSCMWELNRAEG